MHEKEESCKKCQKLFFINTLEIELLDQLSPVFEGIVFPLPLPTLCPACREQLRLTWRNEHVLYSRKCDFSGQEVVSVHASDKTYPVFSAEAWWGDGWNAMSYGRDFDFRRTFFSQIGDLINQVPRAALYNVAGDNSDYNQSTGHLKNCYLLAGANRNHDCYYGTYINDSRDCVDMYMANQCELCYECIDVKNCYNCAFVQNSSNCRNSQFLFACDNCQDCFGCVNLKNKQYCYFNKQLTATDYYQLVRNYNSASYLEVERMKEKMALHMQNFPVRFMLGKNNEAATGNALDHSRDCMHCFDAADLERCCYCTFLYQARDCMDIFAWGMTAELCYYSMEVGAGAYRNLFCITCFGSTNLLYCFQCHNCSDCFGCSGLTNKRYCIFNKQYTAATYEALVAEIIRHMQGTTEWGQFFPFNASGFAYNETIAQQYWPVTKVQVHALGGEWREKSQVIANNALTLSDTDDRMPDDLLKRSLVCQQCGGVYNIIKQEGFFYQGNHLPLPRLCFSCRNTNRINKRNSHVLRSVACAKCQKHMLTAYSLHERRPILCEACYLADCDS